MFKSLLCFLISTLVHYELEVVLELETELGGDELRPNERVD